MTITQVAHFRDGVVPAKIGTSTCDGVLAYATGPWTWPDDEVNRFLEAGKRVHKVDPVGDGADLADILDVEPNAATLAMVASWVRQRWAAHSTAAVYCSRSIVPSVVDALGGQPAYLIVADWTNVPHVPALTLPSNVVIAAVQYATTEWWDEIAVYSRDWLEGVRL